MSFQENVEIEENANPKKYEVGRRLRFRKKNPDELPVPFKRGDVLVVMCRNGCGMGIDVRRERDGLTDMVWPEEVSLIRGL